MRYDLLEGQYTYSYFIDNISLGFYGHIKNHTKKLTIILPRAVDRSKTDYNFQRYSWSDEIDGSVLSFLDPTVSDQNNITIGWFQGNKDVYAIPVLIVFIKKILKSNNIAKEDLTLFGSSAGGFSCLKLVDSFLKSRKFVMNPQTIVYNYYKSAYKDLINWIFPNLEFDEVKELHRDRLKATLNAKNRERTVLYYQNEDDEHHIRNHFLPFLSSFSPTEYVVCHSVNDFFYN